MKKAILLICLLSAATLMSANAQSWHYTSSITTPRRLHSCVVLSDGRVLIAGGSDQNGIALSSAQVYDPATTLWTDVPSMEVARERQATVTGADGLVYVIGGNTNNSVSNVETGRIEAFDPSTNTWHHCGDLTLPRQNHTATLLLDSTILIAGGYNGNFLNECEIFDPRTGQTRVVSSMATGRHDHSAVLLSDGRVMVLGGRVGGADGNYLNSCEIYDPSANLWSPAATMHQGRISASVVEFSDHSILVAGGRNTSTTIAQGAEMFDESAANWEEVHPILKPCNWQAGIRMPDDRYMITGGYSGGDLSTNTIVNSTPTCEWYDRSFQAWYYAPTMNMLRSEHGGVYLHQLVNDTLPKDLLLVTGGITTSNTFTGTCEYLDVTPSALEEYRINQPVSSVAESAANNAMTFTPTLDGVLMTVLNESSTAHLAIYNIEGIEIRRIDLDGPGNHELLLGTGNVPPGTYFVRLMDGSKVSTAHFVIAR